ncbi:MAG: 3'-5' exonuclease [Gemmataceae bacterium]
MLPPFVAIDFETADYQHDSACAIGIVRVEDGVIAARESRLIRPPRSRFMFTYIHGITWSDVANEPEFAELWPELEPLLDGARFLVAHNASFDRSVLRACCERAGWAPPGHPYLCSVRLARRTWRLPKYRLCDVCGHLGIDLDHHVALSDAEAAAKIVLCAAAAGASLHPC